ncbi:MAG: hypothetical protein CUN56_16065, partial [Phototrophicales bacterium]
MAVLLLSTNPSEDHDEKMKGISLVAPPHEIGSEPFESIKQLNSDWVCVLPFAFGKKSPVDILFNHPRQWWGETTKGVAATIKHAHDHDLKVMLKPHIWMS